MTTVSHVLLNHKNGCNTKQIDVILEQLKNRQVGDSSLEKWVFMEVSIFGKFKGFVLGNDALQQYFPCISL